MVKASVTRYQPPNNRVAADGMKVVSEMQREVAAAEHERYVALVVGESVLMRYLRVEISKWS